jgi:hypothetical protein
MEVTKWVKRRYERRAGRNASEAIEPRETKSQADRVENLEGNSKSP